MIVIRHEEIKGPISKEVKKKAIKRVNTHTRGTRTPTSMEGGKSSRPIGPLPNPLLPVTGDNVPIWRKAAMRGLHGIFGIFGAGHECLLHLPAVKGI